MEENNIIDRIPSKSIDEIFAFINILKIASKSKDFRKWLKDYHKIENDSDVFEGYKLFLMTIFKCLINSILEDESLQLEEDEVLFRANFVGVPLYEIPNTCEKTIFIKNIWKFAESIIVSKKWEEIDSRLNNLQLLFHVFDVLYQNVSSTKDIEKEEAIKTISKIYTHRFLNDTHKGYPLGYIFPAILDINKDDIKFQNSFKGYVYSLQYLWYNLLDFNEFEASCIKNLHKSMEFFGKESEKIIKTEFEMFADNERIEEIVKEKIEWVSLDRFYPRILKEIIDPIIKRYEINLFTDSLLTIKDIDKSLLKDFLSKEKIRDPDYLKKNDKESLNKQLDYHFLWYEVSTLNIIGENAVYNGAPAFEAALVGMVNINRYFKIEDKVLVRVFKHPVHGENGFDYSFAILIRAFGTISDYSGWLVFFDCATDYSGLGGSLYESIKIFIEIFEKKKLIDVKTITIDKDVLKEYLLNKARISKNFPLRYPIIDSSSIILDVQKVRKEFEDYIGYLKGKFFEYVVYKWINEGGFNNYMSCKCDFILDGEEIDCLGEADTHIDLFECKINLHSDSINDIISQIEKKAHILKNIYKKDVNSYLVIYHPQRETNKKLRLFEEKGIKVIDNFREEIDRNRIFDRVRKDIHRILEHSNREFNGLIMKLMSGDKFINGINFY